MTLGGNTYNLGYGYTDFGTPSSLTYPDNEVASYGYSGSGAPLSLTVTPAGGTATTLAGTMLYSTATGTSGLLSSESLAGGTYTYAPSYDGDLRVNDRRTTLTGSGAVLYDETLGFDAVGNVSSVNTTLPGGTDNQAFCYDEQNRLTWAGSSGTPPCTGSALSTGTLSGPSLAYTDSLVYDPLDRTTSSSLMGGTFYDDPAHRHAATSTNGTNVSYAYDAAGNMTCRNVNSPSTTCAGNTPTGNAVTYDNEGRMTGWQNAPTNPTRSEAYAHDGEGHVVARQIVYDGAQYLSLYLGSLEELTTGSATRTIASYLLAGNRLAVSTNGSLSYLTRDHLGSATVALDGAGNATASRLYDVRGVPRYFSPSGTMPGAEGYAGQHNGTYLSGLEAMGAHGTDLDARGAVYDNENGCWVKQGQCRLSSARASKQLPCALVLSEPISAFCGISFLNLYL